MATELEEVDQSSKTVLTPERIRAIVSVIPDEWLTGYGETQTPESVRNVYVQFLETRIQSSSIFVKEAQHARESII